MSTLNRSTHGRFDCGNDDLFCVASLNFTYVESSLLLSAGGNVLIGRKAEKGIDVNKTGSRTKEGEDTLEVEGKGQQMSFRMTHDSFGPCHDSIVRVSVPCGSVVHCETRLSLSSENTPLRNRLVSDA